MPPVRPLRLLLFVLAVALCSSSLLAFSPTSWWSSRTDVRAYDDPLAALRAVERRFPLVPDGRFRLRFATHHVQSLARHGDRWFLTSVEDLGQATTESALFEHGDVRRKLADGRGHLFVADGRGIKVADLPLGTGTIHQPGGMSHDGRDLWIPVAEPWQYGHSHVLRVDLTTLQVRRAFAFDDHLAGVVVDPTSRRLVAWNWSSETWYVFTPDGRLLHRQRDPLRLFDAQDAKLLPTGDLLVSGVRHGIGGLAVLTPTFAVKHIQYLPEKTPAGAALTANPMELAWRDGRLYLYFAADDDRTHLARFRLNVPERLPVSRLEEFHELGGGEF